MNSKQAILVFLIIGALGVAVGFNVAGVSKFSDASVASTASTTSEISKIASTSTSSQTPTTRQELLDSLAANGISDEITMPSSYFHGNVVSDYQDILRLAVKAEYVIVPEEGVSVLVGLNGKEFQWASQDSTSYTKYEKLEIQTAVCSLDSKGNWAIMLSLRNSGTATATLTSLYVNDVAASVSTQAPAQKVSTITTNVSQTVVESGQSKSVTLWVGGSYSHLTSGTTINIKIHSAGGMDYIKLIELV